MTDLNPKQHKFIDEFIHCQVEEKAAISAGYKGFWGKRLRAIPMIAAEIDRRLAILHTEQAKQTIKKRELCKELLDDELVSVIKIDLNERPTLGPTKLGAIGMGYERIGIKRAGEFMGNEASDDSKPNFYRALETVTQRTTQETIVHRAIEGTVNSRLPDDDSNSDVWDY